MKLELTTAERQIIEAALILLTPRQTASLDLEGYAADTDKTELIQATLKKLNQN